MLRAEPFPENFRRLHTRIETIRKQINEKADAAAIGREAALLHLDCLARLLTYMNELDTILDYQLFQHDRTLEKNLARVNSAVRMLSHLNAMVIAQITNLMNCLGGTATVGVEQLHEWTKGDPERRRFLLEFLPAAANLAKRSRR